MDETPSTEVVVILSGELDPHTTASFDRSMAPLCDDEAVAEVVVDLSGIRFMGSSGLRTLLSTDRALMDRGACLVIRRPSRFAGRLLDITDLTRHLTVE